MRAWIIGYLSKRSISDVRVPAVCQFYDPLEQALRPDAI